MMDFCLGRREEFSAGVLAFSQSGADHFADVRGLFLLDLRVLVAAVVSITVFLTVCIAKLVGCTLPMLAKRLGFDPAVMASPFITTVVDALSLLVYFAVAGRLLGI